jgi:hypothetical protein
MHIRLLALGALAAIALPACGDSGNGDDGAARTVGTVPQSPVPRRALDLPRGVPLRSSGAPADPAQAKVIRDWTDALRGGDVREASALWAVPSKVQNGTPVIELSSRAAVRLFQASLPCGALVTDSAGAARGFTIVTVRLTPRRGGDCGSGAGSTARTAIRVRDGKIAEWYRLPDDPDGDRPGPGPAPDGGDGDETTV